MSLKSVMRQSSSPAANLLRNSRLFSLPPPLPPPSTSVVSSFGQSKSSDTATLPYPTRQALATTLSGQARGDWGLKRNLPLKSTANTTNPAIRFTAIDTIEHITDFESAQDHVRTVEKWEEMNLPMMMGSTFKQNPMARKSAFERDLDVTAEGDEMTVDEQSRFFKALKNKMASKNKTDREGNVLTGYQPLQVPPIKRKHNGSRWKFDGPWLPTMADTEFTRYLEKKVSERRPEFNRYVLEYVKHKIYSARKAKLQDLAAGEGNTEAVEKKERELTRFSKSDVRAGIQALREECLKNPIESELVQRLVIPFLGLPPMAINRSPSSALNNGPQLETSARSTHPSAGLGYLRTNSYLENHPILGPQATHTPVEARVVLPRKLAKNQISPRIGVGGVVTTMPPLHSRGGTNYASSATENLSLDEVGGQKIWVNAVAGSVTRDGRIGLDIQVADPIAVAIKKGELDVKKPTDVIAKDASMQAARNEIATAFSPEDIENNPAIKQMADFINADQEKEAKGSAERITRAYPTETR